MKLAKIIFNLAILFFIGLAIYFYWYDITSYDRIENEGGLMESVVTWQTLLFFAIVMMVGRILIERTDRKQQRLGKSSTASPFLEQPGCKAFAMLTTDDRVKMIVQMGNQSTDEMSGLFQYAVQHDPDMHVKMAALKRIHQFKNNPRINEMMQDMKAAGNNNDLEPYFSMALHRMGIITLEELGQKINPG